MLKHMDFSNLSYVLNLFQIVVGKFCHYTVVKGGGLEYV